MKIIRKVVCIVVSILVCLVFTFTKKEVAGLNTSSTPLSFPSTIHKLSEIDINKLKSKELLVYSINNKIYAFDAKQSNFSYLGDWDDKYNYNIPDYELLNINGGKVIWNHEPSNDGTYTYRELISPFSESNKISAEVNEIENKYYVEVNFKNISKIISTEEFKLSYGLLPLVWLDANNVLLGEFTSLHPELENFYKLNLNDYSFLPILENIDINILEVKSLEKNKLIAFSERKTIIYDLSKDSFEYIGEGLEFDYIWGWMNKKDTKAFVNNLKTNTQMRLLANTPFLYWPVPSNKSIACDVGCYSGHKGIDIGVNTDFTTPIYAAAGGTVETIVNNQPYGLDRSKAPENGNYVKLRHDVGGSIYYTFYLHLTTAIPVNVGSNIAAGALLGYGANSGYTCGYETATNGGCLSYPGSYSHLHFQVNGSCGDNSCWLNPDAENLWIKNTDGSIKDPPSQACGTNIVNIGSTVFINGQTFICSAHNQINLLEGFVAQPGSLVRLEII